jgi:hypothetical protein
MSVSADIVRSYVRPGQVMRRHLAMGRREDRALAMLMVALGLIFLAEWPGLMRAANADPSVPFDARIGGALMAMVFVAPLMAYAIAGLSRLIARLFGGKGSWFGARLALFWALLAASPLMLLQGIAGGLLGPGRAETVMSWLVLAVFLWVWIGGFRVSERGLE